jgi:subtilisin family serine protease
LPEASRFPKAARLLLSACLVLLCSAAFAAERPAPSRLRLRAGSFDPLLERPALPARLRHTREPSAGHFLLQLERWDDASTLAALRAAGFVPLSYVPDAGWVVRVPEGRRNALAALAGIRFTGPIEPGYKLSEELGVRPFADPARRVRTELLVTIDLFADEDPLRVAPLLARAGAEVLGTASFADTRRIHARATLDEIEAIARIDAVAWIEELGEPVLRNNDARWVVQANHPGATPLWDAGLTGAGQVVGHIDTPIETNACWFVDPMRALPGPDHRKVVAYRSYGGVGGAHGTHTAGTIAGDARTTLGSLDHAGLAYDAKISHTDFAGLTGLGGAPSNLYSLLLAAHQDGARVHSNSWGDDGTTAYTAWCRDIDLYSYENEDALVVFAVTNSLALKSPENAKNVLAVAASGNGAQAESLCSGGAGPTRDGRRKPEIVAPGCGLTSAAYTTACETATSSGTSMACPVVAGSAALVRQYFEEGRYPTGSPSPADSLASSGALVKATLLNGAADMTGSAGYPGLREGWGRLRLDDALYLPGDARKLAVLLDARNAVGLPTAVSDRFELEVLSPGEPLELTLVFTDPPAALMAAAAPVNDLDLELVTPDGTIYLGNVFDSALGLSVRGGAPDPRNNVETILLPDPQPGPWRVRVRGSAVNQGLQGYALIATGALGGSSGGALRYAGSLVDDSGPRANGNGRIDPGETVTLRLDLLNLRPGAASQVTAGLFSEAFDRAAVTGASAAFPDIPPAGSEGSLAPHFELAVSSAALCGGSLPLSVRATDGNGTSESAFSVAIGIPGDPLSCTPYECEQPVPLEVPPTVAASKGANLELQLAWAAAEGAAGYRVWRSGDTSFATASLVASTTDPAWAEGTLADGPAVTFYRIRGVNPCGQEGP